MVAKKNILIGVGSQFEVTERRNLVWARARARSVMVWVVGPSSLSPKHGSHKKTIEHWARARECLVEGSDVLSGSQKLDGVQWGPIRIGQLPQFGFVQSHQPLLHHPLGLPIL